MPGLLKVGRTTTDPTERLDALHTTGVATPFTLEFVARVQNSVTAERSAHSALSRFRVANNREFFRVEPLEAIRRIFPALQPCQIDWNHTKRQPQIQEMDRSYAANQLHKLGEFKKEEQRAVADCAELQERQAQIAKTLNQLGTKPSEHIPIFAVLLAACFFPLPFGFVVWFGAFQILNAKVKDDSIPGFCILLLIAGGIAFFWMQREEARQRDLIKPWEEAERERRRIEESLEPFTLKLAVLRHNIIHYEAAACTATSHPSTSATLATRPSREK